MKKYLLTLATVLAFASVTAAPSDNDNDRMETNRKIKVFNVEVKDQGKTFEIDAKTIKDMPNAVGLEIGALHIIAPQGKIPGVIGITLRPAGDAWVEMVGPQHGSFTFTKAEGDVGLPQSLPMGRYLLAIDGEAYGILVVKPDKVVLFQGPRKSPQGQEQHEQLEQQPAQ